MRKLHILILSVFAGAFVAVLAAAPVSGQVEEPAEDKEYTGAEIYRLFCIVCHGPRGRGSPLGVSLLMPTVVGKSDDEIVSLVTKGNPEKGMMSFGGSLSRNEIFGVMAYIRTLQGRNAQRQTRREPGSSVTGSEGQDLRRGETLFTGKANCTQCHSVFNKGGLVGPALDKLAVRLTPKLIREAVLTPSKSIVEGYEGQKIVTADGKTIIGRRRKDSPVAVQLLNKTGDLWTTYLKRELQSSDPLDVSLMPDGLLSKLSEDEKKALFTFLESLK